MPDNNYKDIRDYKATRKSKLLEKIGQLESSGGANINHPEVESGPQAGETAIGQYGLMPNSIQEMVNRYPSDITAGMSKEELAQKAQEDPEFAKTMAATMVAYLKDKKGLSDEQAAAAWEQGHNLPANRLNLNTARARKFRVLNDNE